MTNNIWHNQLHTEVVSKLDSSREGLCEDEAVKRLAIHEPNRFPEAKIEIALSTKQ